MSGIDCCTRRERDAVHMQAADTTQEMQQGIEGASGSSGNDVTMQALETTRENAVRRRSSISRPKEPKRQTVSLPITFGQFRAPEACSLLYLYSRLASRSRTPGDTIPSVYILSLHM